MLRGDFKSFRHEHHFKSVKNGCLLIDQLFLKPLCLIGKNNQPAHPEKIHGKNALETQCRY
jgi:hypothetical protein